MSGNEIYFSMFLSIFIFNSVFNSRNSDNRMIIHDNLFYDILFGINKREDRERIFTCFPCNAHYYRSLDEIIIKRPIEIRQNDTFFEIG